MRRGAKPYTPPARTAEDDRSLLNWLSMRVADDGKDCHPDHLYERVLVEYRLRLARRLKLTMQPGVYLPRLEQAQQRVDVLRRPAHARALKPVLRQRAAGALGGPAAHRPTRRAEGRIVQLRPAGPARPDWGTAGHWGRARKSHRPSIRNLARTLSNSVPLVR
jgi:hypothetical protein